MKPLVPNCIFTTPEIGTVGLGEQEAQQQGRKIKTGKYLFGALGKALAIGEPIGFVKWVADAETNQLLGAHAVGPHATDIIAEAAVAIRAELTAADLAHTDPRPSHPGRSLDGSRPRSDGRTHSLRAPAQTASVASRA